MRYSHHAWIPKWNPRRVFSPLASFNITSHLRAEGVATNQRITGVASLQKSISPKSEYSFNAINCKLQHPNPLYILCFSLCLISVCCQGLDSHIKSYEINVVFIYFYFIFCIKARTQWLFGIQSMIFFFFAKSGTYTNQRVRNTFQKAGDEQWMRDEIRKMGGMNF